MELIVYYDDEYPTWWISREVSRRIVNFLKSRGFLEYNAEELANWMESSVMKNTCNRSVIVFSQDLVPDTLCRWKSPSSLLRTYLDCGGKIIWMGDTPLYHLGMHISSLDKVKNWSEEKRVKDLLVDPDGKIAERWSRDGPFSVLGVMPVYMDFPSSKVMITQKGKSLRLQTAWYGLRPIILKAKEIRGNGIGILARASKPLSPIPIKKIWLKKDIKEEEKSTRLPSFMEILSKLLGLIPAIIAISTALFTILAGYSLLITAFFAAVAALSLLGYTTYWFFCSKEILVSAWWKKYNNSYPTSGFVRIWDCHIDRITDEMLQELYDIALAKIE